jgi:hypothetical protein
LRFLLIGGTGVVGNLAITWFFTEYIFGLENYFDAYLIGICFNLLWNFALYSLWLFKTKRRHVVRFLVFVGYAVMMTWMNTNIVTTITPLVGLQYYLIVIVGTIFVLSVINFFVFKLSIFKEHDDASEEASTPVTRSSSDFETGIAVAVVALALAAMTFAYVAPGPANDTSTYVTAMDVLRGAPVPEGFVPNRVLTTFGGLSVIILLTPLFGQEGAWLLMNTMFYVVLAFAVFYMFRTLFESERVAFVGMLFVIGNYAPIISGLALLMDAGGWAFYVLTLWGVARYAKTGESRAILLAAAAVGIGALFKEYALLGCVAIATVLMWRYYSEKSKVLPLMVATAFIATVPTILVHAYIYATFQYTYLDWASYAKNAYTYSSRTVEYGKAILSLVQIVLLPALAGGFLLARSLLRSGWDSFGSSRNIAISAVILSGLPALMWGAITQRVLFPLIPGAVALACVFIKQYEERWLLFIPVVVLYIAIAFHTDYLLAVINVPL